MLEVERVLFVFCDTSLVGAGAGGGDGAKTAEFGDVFFYGDELLEV